MKEYYEKVSIIIPCRNEEKYISGCIQSIMEMDYPRNLLEIIIIDGDSVDNTKSIIKELQKTYKNICLINNPATFTPHALNIGVKNAANDFIMIASAHASYPTNFIKDLIHSLIAFQADITGGVWITDVKNKSKMTVSISRVLKSKFGVGNSLFRIGTKEPVLVDHVPFGICKKETLLEGGLYNERLIRNQDIEFSKRLISNNKKIYLIPSVKCKYYARETYKEIFKNNYGNGLWVPLTIYITKRMNSLSTRHFIPLIFLLSLILPLLLSIWITLAFSISVISFIAYIFMIIVVSIKLSDKSTNLFYILLAFVVLHFSYGIGSLVGLFKLNYLFKK